MFKFKRFTIAQDKTAMKVGTDGVLLGAWVTVKTNDEYVLDIGCGTGLIALMIAQRSKAMTIDAVDIDPASAEQAAENAAASEWSQRITVQTTNINELPNRVNYDLIVSNPPFFSDSLLPSDEERAIARHTVSLSFDELIESISRLMAVDGRFSLILPLAESNAFMEKAAGILHLWKCCEVSGRVGAEPNRVMSEYRFIKPRAVTRSQLAIREAEGEEYTEEYKALTRDFYLKF